MKKGYLYLVFIALSAAVVLSIIVIFKLSSITKSTRADLSTKEFSAEGLSLVEIQTYEDSWIQKISKEKNQKEYLYPKQKFHIEFN